MAFCEICSSNFDIECGNKIKSNKSGKYNLSTQIHGNGKMKWHDLIRRCYEIVSQRKENNREADK